MTNDNDNDATATQQSKEQNDGWMAKDRYWGRGFVAQIKTTGNEEKGEVPHVHARQALMDCLKSDDTEFTPEGKPDDPDDVDVGNTQMWEWYVDETYLLFTLAGERELVDEEFIGVRDAIGEALGDEWEVA